MTELDRRLDLHHRVFELLLDKVRNDRYPSTGMLDLLESAMIGPEREQLVEVLMEKVEADRFPSMPMLQRIKRIAG